MPATEHRVSPLVDRWVRFGPGERWAGFTVCGSVGLVAACSWTSVLSIVLGRPVWTAPVLACSMVAGLLITAGTEAVLVGRPRLVCFHDELAALVVAAGVVAGLGRPVLAGLDLAVPGLALFLMFGRVGCLVAGCCHGRPGRRGIRYGPRHMVQGLAPEYVGIPLFPVAAIEAAVLAGLVVVTTGMVLDPAPAGAALAVYLLLHVAARFWLEFLRGDEGRPSIAGLSEAQWTALGVTAGLGIVGYSVFPGWLLMIAVGSLAVGAATAVVRRGNLRLREPRHVRQLVGVVRCADAAGRLVGATTGQGVLITASHRRDPTGAIASHFAFSRVSPALNQAEAAVLGRLARAVGPTRRASTITLFRSGNGVYHLIAISGPAEVDHVR